MEQFSDLIKNRRSMRKFTGEELTQDQVVTLLKAALMSPSSKRSNPWQFIVVDDKETLQQLSICKEMGASFLKDAALATSTSARTTIFPSVGSGCIIPSTAFRPKNVPNRNG